MQLVFTVHMRFKDQHACTHCKPYRTQSENTPRGQSRHAGEGRKTTSMEDATIGCKRLERSTYKHSAKQRSCTLDSAGSSADVRTVTRQKGPDGRHAFLRVPPFTLLHGLSWPSRKPSVGVLRVALII